MVAHCLEVSYYDPESEYFPCPKTGKLIPPDQVRLKFTLFSIIALGV